MTRRIAVLASGGGSNLGAILEHLDRLGTARPGEVVLVASDRPGAGALDRARRRGIEARSVGRTGDPGLLDLLTSLGIDLVALAGYLRMVPAEATAAFRGRMLNVHPSLLPAFGGAGMYGHRVHAAVLARGVQVTGVTVHFVDEAYDQGPIVAQWPVPVLATDDAGSLAARVLEAEHRVYPGAVAAVAAGRIVLRPDGRVADTAGDGADFHFVPIARHEFLRRGGAPPPGK